MSTSGPCLRLELITVCICCVCCVKAVTVKVAHEECPIDLFKQAMAVLNGDSTVVRQSSVEEGDFVFGF